MTDPPSVGADRDREDGEIDVELVPASLVQERDAKIQALERELSVLTDRLSALSRERDEVAEAGGGHVKRRRHPLTPYGNLVRESSTRFGSKRRQLKSRREKLGRGASVRTAAVFDALPSEEDEKKLAQKVIDVFRDPESHLDYLNSDDFARDLLRLIYDVAPLLESEPRVAFLQSPAYVFGDIHGNLEDLHFFSDNVWRLGMALTAGNFVFLGDYVDRGKSCLEVVAYLFAVKLLLPHKVFLLRGNHETRDVNGWIGHYGDRSFLYQCRDRFGREMGDHVWQCSNLVFDRMPLAAVVDQDIFCVHGGIPRPIHSSQGNDNTSAEGAEGKTSGGGSRIQDILSVPRVAGINPPYQHESPQSQQVASDCVWSDPATEYQEQTGQVDPDTGYGRSLRGGGCVCFGHKAVTEFLKQHDYSYIMRAHEAHAKGVAVSKGARVFTVFSTSKDHHQGSEARAGCVLVDFEKMEVINRSPAYRNQYVHQRDSVNLRGLSEREINQRRRLGLIRSMESSRMVTLGLVDEEDEEMWKDLEEEEEEEEEGNEEENGQEEGADEEEEEEDPEPRLDTRRKSLVETHSTTVSHDDLNALGIDDEDDEVDMQFAYKRGSDNVVEKCSSSECATIKEEEGGDDNGDDRGDGNKADGAVRSESEVEFEDAFA